MRFECRTEAVKWLERNPNCQKAIYVDLGSGAFIGDFEELPGVKDDWQEVSLRELLNLVGPFMVLDT